MLKFAFMKLCNIFIFKKDKKKDEKRWKKNEKNMKKIWKKYGKKMKKDEKNMKKIWKKYEKNMKKRWKKMKKDEKHMKKMKNDQKPIVTTLLYLHRFRIFLGGFYLYLLSGSSFDYRVRK